MSGIFGAIHFDQRPIRPEDYQRALESLAHRGPDGRNTWSGDSVLLAHQLLHTTPESTYERQPLVRKRAGLSLTADARIDNRDELIPLLFGGRTAPRGDLPDSELILTAYEKWGTDCTSRLIGDYAFTIWDERRRLLFCARDPMGMKPFYYYHSPDRFVFSSELRALLYVSGIPQRLNEDMIARYLAYSISHEKEATFYMDLVRLPAAHQLSVGSDGRIDKRQYWVIDPNKELKLASDNEYEVAFREVFVESVRARVRSAYPVGSFLSGGLDSSSVTCVARKLLHSDGIPLHTYSAIFPDLPEEDKKVIDERPFVQEVLKHEGYIPHFVRADAVSPLVDIDDLVKRSGQLFFGTNFYLVWSLCKEAHRNGVRVLLDGLDGDTVVKHGHEYLGELAEKGSWEIFKREAVALASREQRQDWGYLEQFGYPVLSKLARENHWVQFFRHSVSVRRQFDVPRRRLYVDQGLKQAFAEQPYHFWRKGIQKSGSARPQLTSRSLLARGLLNHLGQPSLDEPIMGGERSIRQSHAEAILNGVWQSVAELNDPHYAVLRIEPRSPFFDRRLVEFSVSLPHRQRLQNGWTRSILRRAMEGYLPSAVQWRTMKSKVGPGFYRGLAKYARQELQEVITDGAPVLSPYVDIDILKDIYEQYDRDPIRASWERMQIYKVAMLYRWLKTRSHTNQD